MADKSNIADEQPRIGYRSPPVAHRFQPGRSGNPAGRPRHSGLLKTALQKAVFADAKLHADPNVYTSIDALLKSRFDRAIRGDNRAAEQVLTLVANLLDDDEESTP